MQRCWLAYLMLRLLVLPAYPSVALMSHKEFPAEQVHGAQGLAADIANDPLLKSGSKQDDATAAAFQQFQLFLRWQDQAEQFVEYLQHRAEFLDWKQMYRQHQSKKSRETSPLTKEYQRLFPAARYMGQALISYATITNHSKRMKGKHASSQYAKDAHSHPKLGNETGQNIINTAVETVVQEALEAEEFAIKEQNEVKLKISSFGFGDYFIVSGVLFLIVFYFSSGGTAMFWYIVWVVVGLFELIFNLLLCRLPSAGSEQLTEMEFDDGPTIEKNGIRRPSKLLFQQEWHDLTPGQKFVFKIVGIKDMSWNDAVKACSKDPGLTFSQAIGAEWEAFSEFQKGMLRKVDLHKEIWNEEDPENLRIHHKCWQDLSDYEKHIACQIGVLDGTSWDLRKADCFYKQFQNLPVDSQVCLRRIGFVRDFWTCYRDPKVPPKFAMEMDTEEIVIKELQDWSHWLRRSVIGFWFFMQCLWLMFILWSLGVIRTFFSEFNIYIIIFIALILLVYIGYRAMRPLYKFVDRKVIAEIRILASHVKDIWRIVAQLHVHLHVGEKIKKCEAATCGSGFSSQAFPCLPSISPCSPREARHVEDANNVKKPRGHTKFKSAANAVKFAVHGTAKKKVPVSPVPAGTALLTQLHFANHDHDEYV